MRFLLVGTNRENTGAATHFITLAQALLEAGHDVSALASPGSLIFRGLSQSGVRLYPARLRNALDWRCYRALFTAARDKRPDWLVGNCGKEYGPLILSGRLLQVPVALFRHRTPPMSRISEYLVPRLAARFFAVSHHARQAYIDRGVPPQLVQVLHNPVNTTLYRPDPQQRQEILHRLGIPHDAIVLGYFGRMQGGKGIFTLLDAVAAAMAQEPRLHCVWVGDGPDAQALRKRLESGRFRHRHHLVGWVTDVHRYYSALSMLAFPSIAPETFGRVSVEAQACGVPVLASDIGGVPETVAAGTTGLLLPPGDVAAWRDAILKQCDPAGRLTAGAAREFVQRRFSTSVIAREFMQILKGAWSIAPRAETPRRTASRK